MAENNISVKITADIVDLQTKFAIAKAQVNGLTTEMNKLAKQSATGVLDAAGAERLQQFSGDLIAARGEAQRYAGELEKAGFSMSSFASKMQAGHGSISTATREFRALFDELSSGRTRMTPGTLAIIASRVFGLGPAALGAIGGIAALAGGLAYLGIKANEATKALDQAYLGAQFAGNLDISRDQIKQYADEMSKAKNITSSDARDIAGILASIPGITGPAFHALTAQVSDFAAVTGKEAPKIAAELAHIFSPDVTATEYARQLGNVSTAQLEMAQAADKSGDMVREQQAKLQLLFIALNRTKPALDAQTSSLTNNKAALFALTAATESGISADEIQNNLIAAQTSVREKNLSILKQTASELISMSQTPEQTLKTGVEAADKENPVTKQISDANAEIQKMNAALAIAQERGDQINVHLLSESLAQAKEKLSALEFGPVVERMREQMQQLAATWDGTQSGLLAKQIEVSRAGLAAVSQDAKARVEIETEIASKEVQLRQATSNELIAQARNEASAIASESMLGPVQRLQAEQGVWAQLLAGDKLTASGRIEVQRAFNAESVEITRQSKAETDAINRSDADTEIAIARLSLDAKKTSLEADVAANRVSASAKLSILTQLATEDEALSEKALQAELANLTQGTGEYERVYNQIRELKAKLNLDLLNLDRQYEEDVKRQLKEQTTQWKQAVGEIENAESSMVSNLISRRKSLSQTLRELSVQMVTAEITNDIKAFTTKELLNNSEKALDQGGFLYHMLFEQQKAASTVTNQAAQTTAVTSGAAARQTAETTAAATSAAEMAATGPAQVMANAAVAASGAFAATALIPYIGPELAPAAALAAYAEVAAFAPEAALAVGAWNIPHDMTALIHQGETVVPKDFATGAREAGFGLDGADGAPGAPAARQSSLRGSSEGQGDKHFHTHITAMDSRNVIQHLRRGGLLDRELKRAFSHHAR